MKILHHLLASSVCVTILVATTPLIAAQVVGVTYLRSKNDNDAAVPDLPVAENDDDSEVSPAGFPDFSENDDGSSEDTSELVPEVVDDPKHDFHTSIEARRLAKATTPKTPKPKTATAAPRTTVPPTYTVTPKPTKTPRPTNSTGTIAPSPSRPTNATAPPSTTKRATASVLPTATPKVTSTTASEPLKYT